MGEAEENGEEGEGVDWAAAAVDSAWPMRDRRARRGKPCDEGWVGRWDQTMMNAQTFVTLVWETRRPDLFLGSTGFGSDRMVAGAA